jgi:predicted nuclease of restriction endonuclease-like (RecB) superfamily
MTRKRSHKEPDAPRQALGRRKQAAMFPVAPSRSELPENYDRLLDDLRQRIASERVRVVMAANSAMVLLYWDIGQGILNRQQREGWGAKVIDRLSADLRRSFPDMSGLSSRNLKYMRSFAQAWPDRAIVQQVAAQIPWFHNCVLLDKVKEPAIRIWYARKAVEKNGWSRNILELQISGELHKRQGRAISNSDAVLPPVDSDMVAQAFSGS